MCGGGKEDSFLWLLWGDAGGVRTSEQLTFFSPHRFSKHCQTRRASHNDLCLLLLSCFCWCTEGEDVKRESPLTPHLLCLKFFFQLFLSLSFFFPFPPSKETCLVLRRQSCVFFSLVFFETYFLSMHQCAVHVCFPEDSILLHNPTSFLLISSGNQMTGFHFRELQGVFLPSFCLMAELNLKLKRQKMVLPRWRKTGHVSRGSVFSLPAG